MKKLFKYDAKWWTANIEGLFISTQEEVDKLIGKELYLGEIAGKHSEVEVTFEAKDFEIMSEDQDLIAKLEIEFDSDTLIGINPVNQYAEYQEEHSEEEE